MRASTKAFSGSTLHSGLQDTSKFTSWEDFLQSVQYVLLSIHAIKRVADPVLFCSFINMKNWAERTGNKSLVLLHGQVQDQAVVFVAGNSSSLDVQGLLMFTTGCQIRFYLVIHSIQFICVEIISVLTAELLRDEFSPGS